ncbi:hypothetical protein OAB94_02135 [Flavobacteriaceae bacterium]|nr:hypothetical protein [Flavobacteriaceae bacterium]
MQSVNKKIHLFDSNSAPGIYVNPRSMKNDLQPFDSTNNGQFYTEPTINVDSYKYATPRVSSLPFQDSDSTIQYVHPTTPWSDNREMFLSGGMIVYGVKTTIDDGLFADMSLAALNSTFEQSKDFFDKMVKEKDTESKKFDDFLKKKDGEKKLLYWSSLHSKGRDPTGVDDDYDKDMYALASQPVYNCLTRYGILTSYNYLGVSLTNNEATSLVDISSQMNQSHVTTVNIAFAKKVEVANIWGGKKVVRPGAHLYLQLTQDSIDKPYEIKPITSFRNARLQVNGDYVWYVGVVKYGINRYGPESSIRKVISHSDPRQVFSAVSNLEKIEVNLGF